LFYEVGRGERGRWVEGMNLVKVHSKHIWKCRNKPPVQLIYANKMFFKKIQNTIYTLTFF
jgi:hypothetical protein